VQGEADGALQQGDVPSAFDFSTLVEGPDFLGSDCFGSQEFSAFLPHLTSLPSIQSTGPGLLDLPDPVLVDMPAVRIETPNLVADARLSSMPYVEASIPPELLAQRTSQAYFRQLETPGEVMKHIQENFDKRDNL
jgi:hypothetical protein